MIIQSGQKGSRKALPLEWDEITTRASVLATSSRCRQEKTRDGKGTFKCRGRLSAAGDRNQKQEEDGPARVGAFGNHKEQSASGSRLGLGEKINAPEAGLIMQEPVRGVFFRFGFPGNTVEVSTEDPRIPLQELWCKVLYSPKSHWPS